jgi:hypothetical protein
MKKVSMFSLLAVLSLARALSADVFHLPAGLKSLELVTVGDPGNTADSNGFGAVAYPFQIGKHEVTTAQYVEFLNAKAKADLDGNLWNNDMDKSRSGDGARCEIRRSGEKGDYRHTVVPEFANRPVTHVSFLDACRFCNWLHNGQGDGDTETGAYTLNGYTGTDGRRIRRNPGAKFFVPTDDEWYKAAYYDAQKPSGPGYWKYPTRSDAKPGRDRASINAANWMDDRHLDTNYYFLEVGSFPKSPSAYGTLDQAGNVAEWTEGLKPPFLRSVWGGSFDTDDAGRNIPMPNLAHSSRSDEGGIGFRIAAAVPGSPITVSKAPALEQTSAVVDFPRRPWRDPLTKKPFFPLAWFSYASDEKDLDELARQGANLVLFVNGPSDTKTDEQTEENIRRMRTYLDQAQQRQIRVLVQNSGPWKAHMRNDADMLERQRRWVGAIHDHPALFGYQLYDEPEYGAGFSLGVPGQKRLKHFAGSLQAARQSLRTWDPNPDHMISVVFNLVPLSSWTEFLPAVDSFQVDRYPLDKEQAYFGHRGDWGPLIMAWSMAHGVESLRDHAQLRNPSPCMQGVGPYCLESGQKPVWRNPLYDETRYMAYSSFTVGAWGVFHWIRTMGFPESPAIAENVKRLHAELRSLIPAFEQSYEKPPFTVRHNHEGITRSFLTDSVADVTTLALEDETNNYLIVSNNSGTFSDVTLRLKGLKLSTTRSRPVEALNESWSRTLAYSEDAGEWVLDPHTMCFGDINVWVIPKAPPAE